MNLCDMKLLWSIGSRTPQLYAINARDVLFDLSRIEVRSMY